MEKESQSTTAKTVSDKSITKPKFYKSKKFWLITALILVAVGVLAISLWYWRRISYTHRMISESWHALVMQSEKTVTLTDKITDSETLNDASKQLHELNNEVKDKQYIANQVPTWLNDKEGIEDFKKFLITYEAYTALAAKNSDDITTLKDEDLDKLVAVAATAKKSAEDTKKQFVFLNESLPLEVFAFKDDFERYKKILDKAKAEQLAAQSKQAQDAQKDADDKEAVEINVGRFLDGFVAGDATKMRRYMTEAFAKEYNFGNLSDEARKYNYPASYRIIEVKKDGDKYVVKVNVLYKPRDNNGGQYTAGMEYSLIYNSSTKSWLINTEKQGGSY